MRTVPDDDDDRKDLAELNAQPWMVECLNYNPEYVHWGPGEDYMGTKGEGWSTSQEVDSWASFGPWHIDELNEIVHFYFEINRASSRCEVCDGSGLNQATKKISDDFYGHGYGRRWCDRITQEEADVLVSEGRCPPGTLADRLNADGGRAHDGINRWILIKARATRLGVYGECGDCAGKGHIWTEPTANLGVVFWFIHPRKGASRGVRVQRIEREDLPKVIAYLRKARRRNADRFAKVPKKGARHAGA